MKKIAKLITLNMALFSTASVFAVQLEGNYISANIGAAFQPNITYHGSADTHSTGNRFLKIEPKRGKEVDLAFGYQTEDLRVEISGLYLENKIKKSLIRSTYFDITGAPDMGSTKVMGLMANGMYDFNSDADFTPYIGFGIGGLRISQNIKSFPSFSLTSATIDSTTKTCITRKSTTTPGTTSTTTVDSPTTTTTTTAPAPVTSSDDTTTVTTHTVVSATLPPLPAGVVINSTGSTSITVTTAPTPAIPPSLGCTSSGPTSSALTDAPSYAGASFSDSSQLQFAYQTILGASYKIMDELKISIDYRYLRTMPTVLTVMDAGTKVPMRGSYSNHRVLLGLTAFL